MPAERWQSGIHDFFQSIGENDDEITEMFMSSMLSSSVSYTHLTLPTNREV